MAAYDPHNLQAMAKKNVAPLIENDRLCTGCGYNLRGLRVGVTCPECGMPSVTPRNIDDPLSVMPVGVILMVVRGCWAAAICVVLMVGVMLSERFGAVNARIAMPVLAALSVLWCGAVLWLTPTFALPQAVSRGFGPRSRLRTLARWLQLGWVLLTASMAAEAWVTGTGWDGWFPPLKFAGLMSGLVGLVILAILLERLAEWTRDDDAQRLFAWAAWSWPIAMLLYVPVQWWIGGMLASSGRYRADALFVVLWVFAVCTFPYGLLVLAKSVTYAIVHHIEHRQRAERRAEREAEDRQRAGERAIRTQSQPMRKK